MGMDIGLSYYVAKKINIAFISVSFIRVCFPLGDHVMLFSCIVMSGGERGLSKTHYSGSLFPWIQPVMCIQSQEEKGPPFC